MLARPQQTTEVGPYRIDTVKTGRWRQNAYIIQHSPSHEIILIDPGDEEETILEKLDAQGQTPRFVLLTHGHFDHVGALEAVCQRYGLPFYLHSKDYRLLQHAALYAMSFDKRTVAIPESYTALEDARLEWSAGPVNFIHTPGHTNGGVCYHWEGLCFTGDTLLNKLVGRTDLPGSDGKGLRQSIDRMLECLPAETMLFPGHGGPWPVSKARAWWKQNRDNPPEYAMEGMPT
jgi:hydroxyacylglutathione hydrolase